MRLRFGYILFLFTLLYADSYANDKKVALLYPNNTIMLPSENSSWLTDNFYRWELFLMQNKFKYDIIKDDDLESGLSDDYSLLILPAAKCLSEKEFLSIKEFMSDGNSVFSTWSMGVYTTEGKWNGWENLEQLFGFNFVSEIPEKEGSRIHSIFGGTPVSTNIPAGFRLQVTTFDKPIEVRINSSNTLPIGHWQNSLIPFEGKNEIDNTTSAVYGNFGKGNFVWLGFEFSAVVGSKQHQEVANYLLKNIINWLTDDLIVQIETWPNGKQSAAVLSCDVEFNFSYINNALDLLEEGKLPAQFYILTESIDYQSLERLNKIGDVGLHGDDHIVFKWQDFNTQLNRLSNGMTSLEKLTGKKPIAFRPPETSFDDITLDAMSSLNMHILSSDLIEDRAVPQFLESHPEILVIPKTGFDDYDVFQRLKIENVDDQSKRYILDFYRTHEEGGLYSLNFHTQMQCRREFVNALIKPIREIKTKDVWITTHDRVYDWWVKRSKLKLNTKLIDNKNYLVEIDNQIEEQIDDVVIGLHKKNFANLGSIQITLDGKQLDYMVDFNLQTITIFLPRIYPKEIKRVSISF
jgi:peptidoglycan/xylan/chitin deacetylase (PgdA/CDA1 family)